MTKIHYTTVRRISTVGSEKLTYIGSDLNRLCRSWCSRINECPSDRYCKEMETIRRQIIAISNWENDDE